MSKILPALFAFALCAGSPAAFAATAAPAIVSGGDLDALCNSADAKICSVYIAGYAAGFYYASANAHAGFPACMPGGVTGDEARQIVTRFMSQHPEMAQQGAPSVVAEALLVAFPCPQKP